MPLMAALLAFIVWTVVKGTTSKYVAFATTKSASSNSVSPSVAPLVNSLNGGNAPTNGMPDLTALPAIG